MAADAKSFGIALGVNTAIGTICFIFFCLMRLRKLMRKFYMPRQYTESTKRAGRPPPLPNKFAGWISPAWKTSQEEIIRIAGYDAAMYVKILSLAFEVFVWISLWMIIIALPTNLVGHEVTRLTSTGNVPTSQFTYWIPSPPPVPGPNSPPSPPSPPAPNVQNIKAPQFYGKVPPAPAGLEWWVYAPGVPPLPNPGTFSPSYANYQWRYDTKYSAESYTFSQLDKVTMSNIAEESNLLWIHAIAAYFVAFVVMRALWRYSQAAVALHLEHLSRAEKGANSHSIMVTDIPGATAGTVKQMVPGKVRRGLSSGASRSKIPQFIDRSTTYILPSSVPRRTSSSVEESNGSLKKDGVEELPGQPAVRREADLDAWMKASSYLGAGHSIEEFVEAEYQELFKGEVEAVHCVYRTGSLDPLVKEYDSTLRNLEDLLDLYAYRKSSGKEIKRKQTRVLGVKHGEWGKENYPGLKPVKTDLMDWDVKWLAELRRRILEEQVKCKSRPGATAFVTFKSRRSQTIAANSLQHPDVTAWHTTSAAEPNDIIWANVRHRAWERQARFVAVWAAFVALALFYTIPVGALQAIIEVNRLSHIVVFKQLVSVAFVRSIIEAILPGLVLNIFLAILPSLLAFMNKQQGMTSLTQVDFGVIRKYFIFLVVTVFLGSFIGGALFNQFNQWIDNPASAITILGTAAPLTSIFFLTYIMLQALTSLPLSFLRLFGLVMYWIKSHFAATARAKARVWSSEQRYSYGPELPRHMLILFVGIVFSVINPLVPIMTVLYFAVALLTERYNVLYIYAPVFESGGKMWVEVYEQIIAALFFFELVMIALLAIKKSFAAILIGLLIVITFIFWRACKPVFQKPMAVLSLRTAVDMDHNDELSANEIPLDEPSASNRAGVTYRMPVMHFDQEKHESILKEAEDMELVLQGKKELDLEAGEVEESGNLEEPLSTSSGKAGQYPKQSSSRFMEPLVQGNVDSASQANLKEEVSKKEVDMVPLGSAADEKNA